MPRNWATMPLHYALAKQRMPTIVNEHGARTSQYVAVPPGTGKSNLAQAIGFAVFQQRHRVLSREAHVLLEELAEAAAHRR